MATSSRTSSQSTTPTAKTVRSFVLREKKERERIYLFSFRFCYLLYGLNYLFCDFIPFPQYQIQYCFRLDLCLCCRKYAEEEKMERSLNKKNYEREREREKERENNVEEEEDYFNLRLTDTVVMII